MDIVLLPWRSRHTWWCWNGRWCRYRTWCGHTKRKKRLLLMATIRHLFRTLVNQNSNDTYQIYRSLIPRRSCRWQAGRSWCWNTRWCRHWRRRWNRTWCRNAKMGRNDNNHLYWVQLLDQVKQDDVLVSLLKVFCLNWRLDNKYSITWMLFVLHLL